MKQYGMTNIFNNSSVYESSFDANVSFKSNKEIASSIEQASSEVCHIIFSSSLVTDDDVNDYDEYVNYDPLPWETPIEIDVNDLTDMFPIELSFQDNYEIPINVTKNETNPCKNAGMASFNIHHNPQMKYLRTDVNRMSSTYQEKEMLDSYPNPICTSSDIAIPSYIQVVPDDMENKILDSSFLAYSKDYIVPFDENQRYYHKLDDIKKEYDISYHKDSILVHSSSEEIPIKCSNDEIKYQINDAMTRLLAYQSKQSNSTENNQININFNNMIKTPHNDLKHFHSTCEVNNIINKKKKLSVNELETNEDYSENKSPISMNTYETQRIVSPDRKLNHQNPTHNNMIGSSSDSTTTSNTPFHHKSKNSKRYKSKRKPRPKVEVLPLSAGPIHEVQDNDVLCGRGGRINNHCGNVRFREIVSMYRSTYSHDMTRKLQKAHIAANVVRTIRREGGRFLREDPNMKSMWYEIGDTRAIRKAGQALREDESKICYNDQTTPSNKESDVDSGNNNSNRSICQNENLTTLQ